MNVPDLYSSDVTKYDTAYLRQDSIVKAMIANHKDSMRQIYSVPTNKINVIMDLDSLLKTLPDDKYQQVMARLKNL